MIAQTFVEVRHEGHLHQSPLRIAHGISRTKMSPSMPEITLVKAARPGGRDRAYLKTGGTAWRGPIHVIHYLPRLVVESLFGITDELWAELAAGPHAAASHAATAHDPQAAQAGADRLRGGRQRPRQPVAGAWAPPDEDGH
jgi:hypothetical protein